MARTCTNTAICSYTLTNYMGAHTCEICVHVMVFMNTIHTGMLPHGHMRVHMYPPLCTCTCAHAQPWSLECTSTAKIHAYVCMSKVVMVVGNLCILLWHAAVAYVCTPRQCTCDVCTRAIGPCTCMGVYHAHAITTHIHPLYMRAFKYT